MKQMTDGRSCLCNLSNGETVDTVLVQVFQPTQSKVPKTRAEPVRISNAKYIVLDENRIQLIAFYVCRKLQ